MKINQNFWAKKRVFVTGHTGFKGSWLCLWLRSMGAQIRGYALPPDTSPHLFGALELEHEIDNVFADIRCGNELKASLGSYQPEIVFHLAAQPLVRRSYKEPIGTLETNIMGTANLLEAVRELKCVRAVVVVTSDKCYENKEWPWGYRETDNLGGHDPYSASKACAEIVTAAYRDSFFSRMTNGDGPHTAIATARAGNVIGGGDWAPDRLVPDCIRALTNNETVLIRYPKAIRPWQHVLEPVHAYLALAEQLTTRGNDLADAWNFGPGNGGIADVETLVKTMLRHWGSGTYRVTAAPDVREALTLILDIGKAIRFLGYRPLYSFDEAVSETAAWYKIFAQTPEKIRDYSLERISIFHTRMDT